MSTKTKRKILYIEPNKDDQKILENFFTSKNLPYELIVAHSVPEAKNALGSSAFDLVICEYLLGKLTAFDLLDELEDIPYIVLTGQGSEHAAAQVLKAGAADYLIKDPEMDYLSGVSAAIEKARLGKDKEREANRYLRELEEIVSERAVGLLESNQRLADEVSQRAQALEELNESREIYRRFFQTSRDAVFISSVEGRWIDMNTAAIEMFGYQEIEQIWKDSILELYWEPEDRKKFAQTIKEQGFTKDYPVKLRKKDDSSFDALISATSYEIGGKLKGYQGVIRDISEDLRVESERQQLLRQQNALDDLSIAMGTIIALDDLYQCIATHIKDLFEPEVFNLLKYDQKRDHAQIEFLLETDLRENHGALCPARIDFIDQFFKDQVIKPGKPLAIPDFWQYIQENELDIVSDDGVSGLDKESSQNNCSILLAPLVVEDQVIGALQILRRKSDAYSQEDFEVLKRIANVVAIGLQKAYHYKESEKLIEKLTSLRRIERTVLENLSLPTTLDILIEQLVRELAVDAADILYLHPSLKTLKFITQTGFRQNILQHTDLEIGEGFAGAAAQSRSTVHILDLVQEDAEFTKSPEFEAEHFVSYLGVPLLAKGNLVGVLEIFHRSTLDPDQEWLELLDMVSGLAAIAIDLQNLHNDLEKSRNDIARAFDGIIEGWAQALELRGIEPEGHWRRVEDLTHRLALKFGLSDSELADIRRGALLHDIGKMGIPDQLLNKSTRLSIEEREVVGRHPTDAYELLKSVTALHSALDIPLYHHERWDGEGYPNRLAEEDIPLPARLFAIADVWDALITDRSYRKAYSKDEALDHIKNQSGKHFDPKIVKAFLEILEEDGKS